MSSDRQWVNFWVLVVKLRVNGDVMCSIWKGNTSRLQVLQDEDRFRDSNEGRQYPCMML